MHRIACLPDKTQLSIGEGETILQASLRAGIPMPMLAAVARTVRRVEYGSWKGWSTAAREVSWSERLPALSASGPRFD